MSNLNAHYIFYSNATGNTYVMSLKTGSLTTPIKGSPNCQGYPILSGIFTTIGPNGNSQKYVVPGGQTPMIFNGLWTDAASSPSGVGNPLCQGIDRLLVSFSKESNNTMVVAINDNTVNIVLGSGKPNTAKLAHAIFPPVSA